MEGRRRWHWLCAAADWRGGYAGQSGVRMAGWHEGAQRMQWARLPLELPGGQDQVPMHLQTARERKAAVQQSAGGSVCGLPAGGQTHPVRPHSTESPQKAEPRTLASLRTGSTAKSNTMSPDSAEYQGREGSAQRGPGSARRVSAPGKEARGTPPILDASSTQLRAHPAAPSPPAEPCTPLRTCVSTHDAQHLGQGLLAG